MARDPLSFVALAMSGPVAGKTKKPSQRKLAEKKIKKQRKKKAEYVKMRRMELLEVLRSKNAAR